MSQKDRCLEKLRKMLVLALVCMGPVVLLNYPSGGTLWAQSDAVPYPCDFATSGGLVFADSGKKANFGAHGGCKNGEFWGACELRRSHDGLSRQQR